MLTIEIEICDFGLEIAIFIVKYLRFCVWDFIWDLPITG